MLSVGPRTPASSRIVTKTDSVIGALAVAVMLSVTERPVMCLACRLEGDNVIDGVDGSGGSPPLPPPPPQADNTNASNPSATQRSACIDPFPLCCWYPSEPVSTVIRGR